ncbi:MAG TPA: bifunctional UDP-N-acetylmuramoyl-tripeptide:D-alanyl-D-alanine ligase/alanine racemase [Bacteroidales bacterium]|nr:bifunctional UDP-N-acetylmuramoyl-tripeptide:D-alanyl-D-alanine ligase/alanine racemase [Bacteroidales bacterium]HBZ19509.1 bifunctional UDP-N-acetylmuramoyl-tripeptide:D-alanyl-D-alanine ligase/alanine racemase [Bacteroidales bacterium]
MIFTSSDIARITAGTLTGPGDISVSDLVTDSRQISFTGNAAFIAIRGVNHDGHKFIDSLFKRGLRVFIVEVLPSKVDFYPDAAFIVTRNSIEALQLLAAKKRTCFKSPVIAVTGSAGKTIVKEWLSDLIGRTSPVIRSPKSYNSQVGVPLSVWKLDDKFKYGIFEAGISFPGEMEKLQRVIDPDIGIFTNIGDAHSENFTDLETKAGEKLKLFVNASTIIFCRDHSLIARLIWDDKILSRKNLIDWSFNNHDARIFVKKRTRHGDNTDLTISYNDETYDFRIPFSDRASIENAITAASACLAIGMKPSDIGKGLAELVSVAMRMELKSGINNCQLIEDFYNSDPGSLGMALEYLRSQNNRKTTLILSDFVQSGREEKELYSEVADLVRKTGIDKFIGIGKALMRNSSSFDDDARFYYSTDDFIAHFNGNEFLNEMILLKGARVFELEKIGRLLELKVHITVLEINLDAISHNLNEFRKFLNPETRIMAMVKAFGYGAGAAEIAGLMEYNQVSYLGVAYADEGADLRKAGVSIPVIVMNPDLTSADVIIQNNLEPEIYSFSSLEKFAEAASRNGLFGYPVHLKIDTGMHRLGFMTDEIQKLASLMKELSCIRIMSVFSHLASSEDPAFDKFTHQQVELYLSAVSKIRETVGYSFLRHILNTSGILRFPQYQFDMVRPGIGIYGAGSFKGISLRPASRFKTRISQVKRIPAGEPVGYGCADVSDIERVIAILPVGYADGLDRGLGNRKGNLFIKGKRAPLTGNICMDTCMADITGINASEGDEAEIFGQNISINEIARQCETIPYEILTSVPQRVKRVFFRE